MKEKVISPVSPRPFSRLVVACACLAAAMPFVALNSVQASFLEYSASAYGTYAFVGSTVVAGQTAVVSVGPGCGTAQVGITKTGTVATVSVAPVIVTGAINTSASDATNQATATSDVHGISLLGGFITATEVKAVSTTSQDATGFHVSGAGSSLAHLVIGTAPPTVINAVPAPNTTISLPGIGKVVLNEQIVSNASSSSRRGLTVNMIHVYVTLANNLGIPVGTQIIVAHAVSGLTLVGGPGSLDGTAFGTLINGTLVKSSQSYPAVVGCLGNALITKSGVGVNVVFGTLTVLNTGTITDTAQGSVTPALSSSQTSSTVQTANVLNDLVTADIIHAQVSASTSDGSTFNFSDGSSFGSLTVNGQSLGNVAPNTTINLAGIGTLYLHRVIKTPNSWTVYMIDLHLTAGNTLGLPTGTRIIVASASASLHSPAHP
jgi:hypothetical protein